MLNIFREKPVLLPAGATEFERFSDEIIKRVGPIADARSLKFAISSLILHAPPDADALPYSYFVKRLRKTAANQVSHAKLMDIKAEQEAEEKQRQAEATANNNVVALNDNDQSQKA